MAHHLKHDVHTLAAKQVAINHHEAWLLQKEQKQPSQIESYQFQYAFFHYRFAINRFVDSFLKVAAKVVDFAG